MKNNKKKLNDIYCNLEKHFGDLGWWPAENNFEVIVGAILVQNASWDNVTKVIAKLKKQGVLTPSKIMGMKHSSLAKIIKPVGFFKIKSERLKNTIKFFYEENSIQDLAKFDFEKLRKKILMVKGIGPETADSILVYVMKKPTFVASAYAKRIFFRHGLIEKEKVSYNEVQQLVNSNFDSDIKKMNQFHALLVEIGKQFCKRKYGKCLECPLGGMKKSAEFKRN